MKIFLQLTVLACTTFISSCATVTPTTENDKQILIYGASGRIGGVLTNEALQRDYQVTGVSRNPEKLAERFPQIEVVKGDILDRENVLKLLSTHNTVLVSVGGKPTSSDATEYIAHQAAISLIEVLEQMGSDGPRVIFVGNVFTLKTASGELLLDRATEHHNYPMFKGHQLALEAFRETSNVNWSIASPPNGFRLKDRTEKVRFGTDTVLLDAEGKPATISLVDYAYGIFEEITAENFLSQRFTLAR